MIIVYKVFAFIFLTSIISCNKSNEASKIENLDWIFGQWKNKMKEGLLIETWQKKNDSVFSGESYFIKGTDTLHSEQMEIVQNGENLLYISTIRGENNDKPQTLVKNPEIENYFQFENPKITYPKKITYKRFAKNKMLIEITGIQFNKTSNARFTLKKTE